jgi:hypothetical protein
MRKFLWAVLIAGAIIAPGHRLNAAPAGQVSCIYETVAPEKLSEFGKATIGEEAEAGLDPIFNAAQNACIDQYGWSEADAGHAGDYFLNRVARERLAALIRQAGLDTRKLDRAYEAVLARFKQGDQIGSPDQEVLVAAFQKEGFLTSDAELLKAAIGYAMLRKQEDAAQTAFIQGVPPAP